WFLSSRRVRFYAPRTPAIYTLSLHDALPISAHPALQDPQPLPEYSALCAHHRQKRQPWFQEPTVQPEGCRQSPLHCPVPVRAERECLQAQDFSERRRGYVTTTHC